MGRLKGVHLRFMTSAGYPTKPNAATQCQLTQARVRIETSKPEPVKFKLWAKVGNGNTQSQFVETMSKFTGPGTYEAAFTKPLPVDKATSVKGEGAPAPGADCS